MEGGERRSGRRKERVEEGGERWREEEREREEESKVGWLKCGLSHYFLCQMRSGDVTAFE